MQRDEGRLMGNKQTEEAGDPPVRFTIAIFKIFTALHAARVPNPQIYLNAIK
jgi:hypothetical protein